MGILSRTKYTGALTAVALAGSLLLAGAPAQAAKKPIDITGFNASDQVISNSNCRRVKISAKLKKNYIGLTNVGYWLTSSVSRNGGEIDSAWFADTTVDYVQICPSFEGLGAYKIGPTDISVDYEYVDRDGYLSYGFSNYWDATGKTIYLRGKTKSTLTAKRSGKNVTLTTTASVYSPEKYRYAQYNPTAKLQVKSGTRWKTLKTAKLKSGKATFKLKESKKKTYRVTIPKASWATAVTSKSVSK